MNILGLFGLASFLKSMRPEQPHPPRRPSWIGQQVDELSDDLDYYLNKFAHYNSIRQPGRDYKKGKPNSFWK